MDYVGARLPPRRATSIDALCHVAYQGSLYNDRPETAVTRNGAAVNSIEVLKDGFVGRGVLLDIPRTRGVPWLEPGEHVSATISRRPSASRRGRRARATSCWCGPAMPADSPSWVRGTPRESKAGLHPTRCGSLPTRGVAALGSDGNSDTAPSTTDGVDFPIHVLAIAAMGSHLLDYLQFEDLTARLRAHQAVGVPVHRRALADRGWNRLADEPDRRAVMPGGYRIKMARAGGMRAWSLSDTEADLHCTWVPGAGMLGASLVHGGDELLWQGAGVRAYARERKFMGIPFLHPWANRLDRFGI